MIIDQYNQIQFSITFIPIICFALTILAFIINLSSILFLYLLVSQKEMKKFVNNTNEKLIKVIFNHINYLPEKQIESSTLLFSRGQQSSFAFKYLNQKQRPPNTNYPLMAKLKQGQVVIDPTITFLSPETEGQFNFVTLHYLMRVIKHAKFVFVFNHSDTTQHPLNNIGSTLKIFITLFKHVSDDQWQQICKSSSIWITQARNNETQVYYQRLVGSNFDSFLLQNSANSNENKFFKNPKDMERAIILLKEIINGQKVLFTKIQDQDNEKITQNFLKMIHPLKFYKMQANMRLNLKSSYDQFIKMEISSLWKDLFQQLYNNIDLFATNPEEELIFFKKIDPFSRRQDKYFKPTNTDQQEQHRFKSVKYLKLIYGMIQIADQVRRDNDKATFDIKNNKIFMNRFLQILYQSRILNHPFIKIFLRSSFLIFEFMYWPEGFSNNFPSVFQKVQFLQIYLKTQILNPKLKSISTKLIQQLQKDLQKYNNDYPYQQCFKNLKQILNLKQIDKYTFLTDRIVKKLQKGLVKIIHHQIKSSKAKSKQNVRYKLRFLEESRELQLICNKEKTQIGISLVKDLMGKKEVTEQAVKILQFLPIAYNINEIMKIYESQLKLNVQYLKFMPEKQRDELISKYLQSYFQFLIKIGKFEQARKLCLQCFNLTSEQNNRLLCQKALVQIRGSQLRNMHHTLLQESILEDALVIIPEDYLKQLRQKLEDLSMI